MPDIIDFESKIKELEQLADKMESGDMSLEDSLTSYEKAMLIIKECETYIENARLRIEKISDPEADGTD